VPVAAQFGHDFAGGVGVVLDNQNACHGGAL
jgi:hypothetical protein